MHIASVGTKTGDPNPQQQRKRPFRLRIACVSPPQLDFNNPQSRIPETSRRLHSFGQKRIANISNMVLKTFWVHLYQKFCLLSFVWRISASRPAHLRIWHLLWDLSKPKPLTRPVGTAHALKSAFCRLHQPRVTLPRVCSPTRRTDEDFLLGKTFLLAERGICCSTHIQGTQYCSLAIIWTTGECLLRFALSVCLHFACLVTVSWMRSQPATHRFRSWFHEPKTSNPLTKMLWHRWFYLNTVDRSVWHAFMFLRLHLWYALAIRQTEANPMHPQKL